MNKFRSIAIGTRDIIVTNGLRQKIFLIALLILVSFVYVMFFAPPKTDSRPAYDQASQRAEQKITGKSPLQMSLHMNGGLPIGVTLYFNKPAYVTADKYDFEIKDSAGNVVFTNSFTVKSLNEANQLVFGLTNMPKTGGDYTLAITAKNVPAETALSIYTRTQNGETTPQADVTYSLGISRNVLNLSFWLVFAGCIVILFYSKKIHVNVLVTILVFGVFFTIITPQMDVPDEARHMGKSFMVANGYLFDIPGGAVVSNSMSQITDLGQFKKTLFNTDLYNATIQQGTTTSTLGNGLFFLGYIPSAIVIFFSQVFHAGVLQMFYAGRIINLIAYAICAYFAVKIAPRYKIFLSVIAAAPMAVYIAASYNADWLTYGLSLLLAAYFIRLYFEKGFIIRYKHIILFAVICAVIGMIKYNLLPFGLLLIFIPASRFSSKKTKLLGVLISIIIPLIAAADIFASQSYQVAAAGTSSALSSDGVNMMGANIGQQLQFMMSSLTTSVSIMLRAFVENSPSYLSQLFTFGWLTYSVPAIFVYLYVAFLALTGFIYSKYEHDPIRFEETKMTTINKFGVFLVLAAAFTFINVILYLTWTPVGANFIQGVQGRYFIPLLLFLPFLSSNIRPQMDEKALQKKHLRIMAVAQGFVILSIIQTLFTYY